MLKRIYVNGKKAPLGPKNKKCSKFQDNWQKKG